VAVLLLKRNILTEKVARKGYHVSREYSIDPLEVLFVKDVMETNVVVLPAKASGRDVAKSIAHDGSRRRQRLYPVADDGGAFLGVVTHSGIQHKLEELRSHEAELQLEQLANHDPIVAYPEEPLSRVADRMARHGVNRMPVVDPEDPARLLGLISMTDCLQGRARNVQEEERRERVLRVHHLWRPGSGTRQSGDARHLDPTRELASAPSPESRD
ncbi:MAG: CBS domain-containing protein, partial [Cyanobacteria bacterium REEB65]|nr:CBS domain-containing protein [Cyanobacteria bacterium REEB65]